MKDYLLKNNKVFNKRGFSLLETIVAISIFSIAVLSILVILGSDIANTNYAKRKIVASFLAEEGIEVVRNIRDTYDQYSVNPDGWVDFSDKLILAQCETNPHGCYFDLERYSNGSSGYDIFDPNNQPMPITGIFFGPCSFIGCPELFFDSSLGKYTYTSNGSNTTLSGFSRTIKIEVNSFNGDEIKVLSTVSWKQGNNTHSVAFQDNLYNWIR